MKAYMNIDVMKILEEIVERNTLHSKVDFELDKIMLGNAAITALTEKHFLWMSTKDGTNCVVERDAYLTGTESHFMWTYPSLQFDSSVAAYAVEVTDYRCGKVYGNLFELDYREHIKNLKNKVLKTKSVTLLFNSGEHMRIPFAEWETNHGLRQHLHQAYSGIAKIQYNPAETTQLATLLYNEREERCNNCTYM
jgi:hypothetical protein